MGEKAELTKSDMLFRQMKQPLEQVMQVVKLMLYLTLGTSAIVITLLYVWMRVRKIAVYISLGKSKFNIITVIIRKFLVFTISSVFSIAIEYFGRKIERSTVQEKYFYIGSKN